MVLVCVIFHTNWINEDEIFGGEVKDVIILFILILMGLNEDL